MDRGKNGPKILSMTRPLIIGTRGSPLALWQARWVQSLLAGDDQSDMDARFPIRIFTTSGDILKGELKEFGGKGLFTKELENSLLNGEIDMAVHSMKDVPTQSQDGLQISAILPRADHRDGFISKKYSAIDDLPQGALVGTASIRRRAQLSALRPDIKYCLLRGNVGTRLAKLQAGVCDATFLACAGLKRLGQAELITETVNIDRMLNAPAQGAVGIETHIGHEVAIQALSSLHDTLTGLCVSAERGFLEGLDGSCRTPIAAFADWDGENIHLKGEVLSLAGDEKYTGQISSVITDVAAAQDMGLKLAATIRKKVGDFDRLFKSDDG